MNIRLPSASHPHHVRLENTNAVGAEYVLTAGKQRVGCEGSEADVADEKPNKDRKPDEQERNEEYDNFQRLLEGTLSVPKEELDRRREEYERERKEKRAG